MSGWTGEQGEAMVGLLDAVEAYARAFAPELVGAEAREDDGAEITPFEGALGWFVLGVIDDAIHSGELLVEGPAK